MQINEGPNIRLAQPDDAGSIADIYCESYRVALTDIVSDFFLQQNDTTIIAEEHRSNIECGHEGAHYVIEVGGEVKGFAIAGIDGTEVRIFELFIAPDEFRKGYGTQLLAHIEEEAKRMKATKITLEVIENDERATSFYVSQGFEPDLESRKPYIDVFSKRNKGIRGGELYTIEYCKKLRHD